MRWNETLVLLSPTQKYQDATGAWHEGSGRSDSSSATR